MFDWLKKKKDTTTEEPPTASPAAEVSVGQLEKKPVEHPKPVTKSLPMPVLEGPEFRAVIMDQTPVTAQLAVYCPAAMVASYIEEAFKIFQSKARFPGFRAGKAPLAMVKQSFAQEAWHDALEDLLRDGVFRALDELKIVPAVSPRVESVEAHPDQPLRFVVKLEKDPLVEPKGCEELSLNRKPVAVTDQAVDNHLETIREQRATLIPADEEALTPEHFAVISYEALLDGQPLPNGKAEHQLVDLSSPQSLLGFREGLLQARAGEVKEIPVAFPADHPDKTLAGKTAHFKVTVESVRKKKKPALDDEFARDLNADNLANLKEVVRQLLTREGERAQREDLERQVIEGLLQRNPFEVPPTLVTKRAEELLTRLKELLEKQGARPEDWAANEARFREQNKAEAEKQVRLSYLLTAIAEREKLAVMNDELDQHLNEVLGSSSAGQRAKLEKAFEDRRESLRAAMMEKKVFEWLIGHAKITDKSS